MNGPGTTERTGTSQPVQGLNLILWCWLRDGPANVWEADPIHHTQERLQLTSVQEWLETERSPKAVVLESVHCLSSLWSGKLAAHAWLLTWKPSALCSRPSNLPREGQPRFLVLSPLILEKLIVLSAPSVHYGDSWWMTVESSRKGQYPW